MRAPTTNYFVVAATVSAELHKAMLVAKNISLTASNARALALRAGQSAAGFRAITDFIEELAAVTVRSSKNINTLASQLSRTASEAERAENALARFEIAIEKAQQAQYLNTINEALQQTTTERNDLQHRFNRQVTQLRNELDTIAKELRTATILSAMSRIEASHTAPEFTEQLHVVAGNVADAARNIQQHVLFSQRLFSAIP